MGIDLAEEAIRQGEHRVDDRVEFLVSDAEAYQPAERWDAIVFNESVYFFDAPIDTVLRYRDALSEGGTLIVSTYRHATFRFRSRRGESIAKKLVERLPLFEEVAVTTSRGTWLIQVFRPG